MSDVERISLFAADLDDTLLGDTWRISARNMEALRELADSGVEVCVLSGRMPGSIKRVLNSLAFINYVGCYHGALVQELHTGRTVVSCPISEAALTEIQAWTSRAGYRCIYFVGDDAIADTRDAVVEFYELRTGATVHVLAEFLATSSISDVSKMIVYDPRETYRGKGESSSEVVLYQETLRMDFPSVRSMKTGLGYVELTHMDATKGAAVRRLSARLGITPQAASAIGDSYNDLDMLTTVSLSFAVGNAVPEVLGAVTRVVGANTDGGVAEAVELVLAHNRHATRAAKVANNAED
jgi:Cof subfamily protein (haloacid dehalogenase superfamily)